MYELFFSFILGTIIGSFSNVVIYRLPRRKSIVTPPSQCRSCGNYIRPSDNIPILSYLILRGKCRFCGEHISLRYPFIEFITGVLFLLLYIKFQFSFNFLLYFLFVSSLIAISVIDYDFKIIQNVITIPGIIFGLLANIGISQDNFIGSIIGILVGGVIFYTIALISRGGMGGGDIKLIAMVGTFLGWEGVLFTIIVGSMIGSVIGIILILTGKKSRRDKVPFGPFISLGAVLYIFVGEIIINFYLNKIS